MSYTLSQREALRKYLAVLDRSIGELSKVRYEFAAKLLDAEAEERRAEHYANLAAEAWATDTGHGPDGDLDLMAALEQSIADAEARRSAAEEGMGE